MNSIRHATNSEVALTVAVVVAAASPASPMVAMTARWRMIVAALICDQNLVVIICTLLYMFADTAVGVCALVVAAGVGIAFHLLLAIPAAAAVTTSCE